MHFYCINSEHKLMRFQYTKIPYGETFISNSQSSNEPDENY